MKIQKLAIAALGAVCLAGATLTMTLTSNAQGGGTVPADQFPPPAQAGPRNPGPPGAPPFGGGDAPPQFRQGGGFMGGGGGGGTAMDSDNSFLYIVQGNMIFKVSKSDLRVMARGQLMEMPQGLPGGRDQGIRRIDGQRPPGGGQGGGVRPPSEAK